MLNRNVKEVAVGEALAVVMYVCVIFLYMYVLCAIQYIYESSAV